MREIAARIYDDYKDMDCLDYEEHYESDLAFLTALVENIGERATRAFLNNL